MPIKGANQVKGKLRQAVAKIDKKAAQFVVAVINDAGILSKTKAPIEFGLLINSQQSEFTKGATTYTGELSYNTVYASILNDGVYKWKPRPVANKKGPSWNPNAEPHFLEYGFESPEAKQMIEANKEMLKI